MKFASLALASTLLFAAIAPTAQAQTASQYQHQLNRAICLNHWTEALSFARLLIGSEQTTPQQRQQLIALRDQLENHRASNAVFDRSGEPGCAAAIAAAPREAAALQAASPPPRRSVQPSAVSRPAAITRSPQSAINRPTQADLDAANLVTVNSYCDLRRRGLSPEAAAHQAGAAYLDYFVSRYGRTAALEFTRARDAADPNRERLRREWADFLLAQCPELL